MENLEIINLLNNNLKTSFLKLSKGQINDIEEIRLRANQPLMCKINGEEKTLNLNGICSVESAYKVMLSDIKNTLKLMSNFSLFSIEEQLKKGFFTLKGGHRVGVCGKTIIQNGDIMAIKDISSLNIRVSRQVVGCSYKFIKYILSYKVKNTLILSAPNNGKTTLLRDIVRNISNLGYGCVVVDERSEIAGSYNGETKCDLGTRCDILDACDKVLGMTMALRSMSPKVIVVDEIGTDEDANAVKKVFNSGVNIIATTHAESIEELKQKYIFEKFLEQKFFDTYIFMKDKVPSIIYDKDLNIVYKSESEV